MLRKPERMKLQICGMQRLGHVSYKRLKGDDNEFDVEGAFES